MAGVATGTQGAARVRTQESQQRLGVERLRQDPCRPLALAGTGKRGILRGRRHKRSGTEPARRNWPTQVSAGSVGEATSTTTQSK